MMYNVDAQRHAFLGPCILGKLRLLFQSLIYSNSITV